MPETTLDQAKRLAAEASALLSKKTNPSAIERSARLIQIGEWFGRNLGNADVRAPLFLFGLVPQYLSDEPKFTPNVPRLPGGQAFSTMTGRAWLLWGLRDHGGELGYYAPAGSFWPALAGTIARDPDLDTQIKALQVVSSAAIPADQYDRLIGALDQMRDALPASPASASARGVAAALLASVRGRLTSEQAQAQQMLLFAQQSGAPVPLMPPPSSFSWKPWVIAGTLLGVIGGAWVLRRRQVSVSSGG